MFRFGLLRDLSPDYYMLPSPRADGPVVGYIDNRPIAATVVDEWGRCYGYVGLAPRRHDGQYDVSAIKQGEWLVEPGLLYAWNQPPRRLFSKLFQL